VPDYNGETPLSTGEPLARADTVRPITDLGMPGVGAPDPQAAEAGDTSVRWLMSSDVCKHCTHAACLDVCPTGALFRTEFGSVVVQADVCNGCGYCVSACPYGVIAKRKEDGRAFKCTLCYDRLKEGEKPACAKAVPDRVDPVRPLDELRERAHARVERCAARASTRRGSTARAR
jgi:formate dehydrogenase iron-sulfur subunit